MTRDELQHKINSFGIEISFPETEIPTQFLTIEVASKKHPSTYFKVKEL